MNKKDLFEALKDVKDDAKIFVARGGEYDEANEVHIDAEDGGVLIIGGEL